MKLIVLTVFFLLSVLNFSQTAHAGELRISWRSEPPLSKLIPLKTWKAEDLKDIERVRRRERAPGSSEMSEWRGYLLEDLIARTMEESLSLEQRSRVDLVVLKNAEGVQALIPRGFLRRHWVLMANERNGVPVAENEGPWRTIVPWSTRSIQSREILPLETYFISQVTEIELTGYEAPFRKVFLTRRTDPRALRGEQVFVQNCMGCHAVDKWPDGLNKAMTDLLASGVPTERHSGLKGMPRLDEKEWSSFKSFLQSIEPKKSETP
jgi:hypothetical protein